MSCSSIVGQASVNIVGTIAHGKFDLFIILFYLILFVFPLDYNINPPFLQVFLNELFNRYAIEKNNKICYYINYDFHYGMR